MTYVPERDLPRKRQVYWEDPEKHRARGRAEWVRNNENHRRYLRERYHANRDEIRRKDKEKRAANQEHYRAIYRRSYLRRRERILIKKQEYYKENKEMLLSKRRAAEIKFKYGLTGEQYTSLFHAQGGCCAVCGVTHNNTRQRRMCIDHDHTTGEIWGLLCSLCNHAMERLESHAEWTQKALSYMSSPPARAIFPQAIAKVRRPK